MFRTEMMDINMGRSTHARCCGSLCSTVRPSPIRMSSSDTFTAVLKALRVKNYHMIEPTPTAWTT
jgi:hypothetical protein